MSESEYRAEVCQWLVTGPGVDLTVDAKCRTTALAAAYRQKNSGMAYGAYMGHVRVTCLDKRPRPPKPPPPEPDRRPTRKKYGYWRGGASTTPIYIYAVECGPFIKFGISWSPKKRVQTMRGNCPYPIEIVASYPLPGNIAADVEQEAMHALVEHHHSGEWFECPADKAASMLEGLVRDRVMSEDAVNAYWACQNDKGQHPQENA